MKKSNSYSSPIAYAKKHWIVYLIPALLILAGFFLIATGNSSKTILGAALIFGALLRIAQASTTKWSLTSDYLVVQTGLPWAKKRQEIPVFDLYQASAESGIFSRFFNLGRLSAQIRETNVALAQINISGARDFHARMNTILNNSTAQPLNNALRLAENGLVSKADYELVKLGVLTQKYFG